jgi:phage-related holin
MRLLLQLGTYLVNLFTLSAKTLFSLRLATLLTPALVLIERYLFKDWHFLGSLCVLIMVDTVFGVQHHWVQHSISSRAFSRLFTKCGIYLGLLVLTHQLTTFEIDGAPNQVFTWFDTFMYSCMMAREAVSILEHMSGVAPGLVPKGLLKRLKLISNEGIEAGLNAMPVAQHSAAPLNLTPPAPVADVALPDVATAEPASLTPSI